MEVTRRGLALVTGASSGIGMELARIMAADGWDLVLVARSAETLKDLAADLAGKYGRDARALPLDLSRPDAAEQVAVWLDARGLAVDALVNNAGYATYGPFADTPVEDTLGMLRLNMEALTHLTLLLLPGMRERRRGWILNVASAAAFQPGPFMAGYYATKAYILHLSEALGAELAPEGILVSALCPGPVKTGFGARAGVKRTRLFRMLQYVDAADVARAGYQAMLRGKPVVIPGLWNRIVAWSMRLVSRRAAVRLVHRLQAERKD